MVGDEKQKIFRTERMEQEDGRNIVHTSHDITYMMMNAKISRFPL